MIVDDAYHYLQLNGMKGHHQTALLSNYSESDSGFSSEETPGSEFDAVQVPYRLFVFSSADQSGLSRLAAAYGSFLDGGIQPEKLIEIDSNDNPALSIGDLAYTLGARRSAFDHRTFVVSRSMSDLGAQLQGRLPSLRRTAKTQNIFFIFTGQGAQWATMGKELAGHRAVKHSLEASQTILNDLGCAWSIQSELFASVETSQIDSPDISQPVCTALQIALVDLLKSWGINPKSVVGHSSGEIGK